MNMQLAKEEGSKEINKTTIFPPVEIIDLFLKKHNYVDKFMACFKSAPKLSQN